MPAPPPRHPGDREPRVYPQIPETSAQGFDGQLLLFAEDLREEGLAVGTSEILDSFDALQHVPWTKQADFKEALAATLAKSPEDRRVFDLVFERPRHRPPVGASPKAAPIKATPTKTARSTSTRSASRSPRR
jgi:hypothetical protein